MPAPEAAFAEAIRHIREIALREAMAICNRMQPEPSAEFIEIAKTAFRVGHRAARMQIYFELERMIASEVPPPPASAGYFTSDGIEDA